MDKVQKALLSINADSTNNARCAINYTNLQNSQNLRNSKAQQNDNLSSTSRSFFEQTNGNINSTQVSSIKSDLKSLNSNVNIKKQENQNEMQKIGYKIQLSAFKSVSTPEELKNMSLEDSRHYKVLGENRTFYTRPENLSQKIKEIHNYKEEQERQLKLQGKKNSEMSLKQLSDQAVDNILGNNSNNNKMEIEEEKDLQELFEYDKNNRYFLLEQKQQLSCRRCKKLGHYERMCMIEFKSVCNYCLGEHLSHQCQQSICFNCNQQGHVSRNCPLTNSKRCARCQKVGHLKADCGAILLNRARANLQFRGIEDEWKKTDDQKIKCLDCKKKGHTNCKNAYLQSIKDDIYGKKYQDQLISICRKEEQKKLMGQIINFNYIDETESSSSSTCNSVQSACERKEMREIISKIRQTDSKQVKQIILDESEDIQIHVHAEDTKNEYLNKKNKSKTYQKYLNPEKEIIHIKKDNTIKKLKQENKNEMKKIRIKNNNHQNDYNRNNPNSISVKQDKFELSFGSDQYQSDISKDDQDYIHNNKKQRVLQIRRINENSQNKLEEDRIRERSKQNGRIQEIKQIQLNKQSEKNIFNNYNNKNISKQKNDSYFEYNDQNNIKNQHHHHHHKRIKSEGRDINKSQNHSKHNYDRDHENSVFVERTQSHKHKHKNQNNKQNKYEKAKSSDKKQKMLKNNIFDESNNINHQKKQKLNK